MIVRTDELGLGLAFRAGRPAERSIFRRNVLLYDPVHDTAARRSRLRPSVLWLRRDDEVPAGIHHPAREVRVGAICGHFRLDAQPVRREQLTLQLDALAHRAPEGFVTWTDGAIALGERRGRSSRAQ